MSGVFAISRGVFEHPQFAPEPFTEREAWIWLIGEAAWKPRRVRVGNAVIDLCRGQCAFSTRFMAAKWKWTEPRVRRFLNRLKIDAMVLADTDAGATRITICKYNEYQRVSKPTDADIDAPTDAEPTQERRKEEDREYIEDKEDIPLRGRDASNDVRKRLFDEGVGLLAKLAGMPERKSRGLIGKWLKDAGDDAGRVLAKLRQAQVDDVADAVSWVTAALKPSPRNWRDEPEYRGVQIL